MWPWIQRVRRSRVRRYTAYALMVFAVIVAAALVSALTVDLGPALKARAEREASTRIERPFHIGRLRIRLVTGQFILEDVRIEGLTPDARPFLTARRLAVSLPWWTIVSRELLVESVEMTDWRMLVEMFPNGRHTFPKFTSGKPPGPKRFVTTVKYVRATRGEFTYDDHGTPWSTIARNLDVTVTKLIDYRGQVSFSNGTVQIQSYEPMWANMRSTFKIVDGKVVFDRIDLESDGARSLVTGHVDLRRWPEQLYQVRSRVHFPRMRELFFARDTFSLHGDGDFTGTFHLFKGGRELKGTFASEVAGVNAYRFPSLRGSLLWLPDRLEVFDATATFFDGTARFNYSMAPLGARARATARFDASYEGVDLAAYTDFLETRGIRIAGRASGRNLLEWPLGRFRERRGHGVVTSEPPAGVALLGRQIPAAYEVEQALRGPEVGPFDPDPDVGYVPVGGTISYRFDPEWIDLAPSDVATPRTYVSFSGRTAYGERSRIEFHVTSGDWQESDRLLVGIMNAFGSSARPVPLGGSGEFDGVLLNAFARPRIEGRFHGTRLRGFDVTWGDGRAAVVVENGYVDVSDGYISRGASEIFAQGRFALGYPRRDRGEEINSRTRLVRWPLSDLRHAFELDDYPVDGAVSGEFHVYGNYQTPYGFGRLEIDRGVAYGEPFERATAGLRFEGAGVRLDTIRVDKGGGTMTGAAYVAWAGSYSFNTDARRIPLESVASVAYPGAPLTGVLDFSVSGSGTFAEPRYEVKGRISDLFVRDEGIGQVTGLINVRGDLLTLEVEAASPRLAVSGSGRIALTPEADAELSFRFTDTSLDPYVRAFEPRLSPFTTAVASGSIRVVGELKDVDHLLVEGTVDQLGLKLFDYRVRNDGPIEIALDQHTVRLTRMRLVGDGTALDLSGDIALHDERINLRATGDANLGILQGFFRAIRSSGGATLIAEISGPLSAPLFSGSATISSGRIRHFSLPHSLESINGRITFDAAGVRLEDVAARLGGGDVRFGGRIGLKGYVPGALSLTARGEQMRLRYPEGIRSVIDADLALRGDFYSPLLTGTVDVRSAVWSKRFDPGSGILDLAGAAPVAGAPPPSSFPLRFDVRIVAPSTLRIENNAARIVSSAELTLRGTYDRPLLFGRADIERGEVLFEGNRFLVTRGTIDFANPTRIEPFFDVEAETRVRTPGQTYRVVFHASGTGNRIVPDLTSDPPLPTIDILSMVFGDVRDPQDAELRSLRRLQGTAEQDLIQARAARLLASPISSEVGRVAEQAFGVDTVQITPSLGDLSSQQSVRLNPGARLTIGKRISERAYLTFSRALSATSRDQIILLEFDQSERLAWIFSRNEDSTYALDFRVRHTF